MVGAVNASDNAMVLQHMLLLQAAQPFTLDDRPIHADEPSGLRDSLF